MTHEEIRTAATDLITMAMNGKILEAMDKYSDDNIVTQEGVTGKPSEGGKKKLLENYKIFLDNMTEVNTYKGKLVSVGENVSAIEWELDFKNNLPGWEVIKLTEIAVQEWKDGKIARETFFYNPQ